MGQRGAGWGGEREGFGAVCCAPAAPMGVFWLRFSVRVLDAVGLSPAVLQGWKYPDQATSAPGASGCLKNSATFNRNNVLV